MVCDLPSGTTQNILGLSHDEALALLILVCKRHAHALACFSVMLRGNEAGADDIATVKRLETYFAGFTAPQRKELDDYIDTVAALEITL